MNKQSEEKHCIGAAPHSQSAEIVNGLVNEWNGQPFTALDMNVIVIDNNDALVTRYPSEIVAIMPLSCILCSHVARGSSRCHSRHRNIIDVAVSRCFHASIQTNTYYRLKQLLGASRASLVHLCCPASMNLSSFIVKLYYMLSLTQSAPYTRHTHYFPAAIHQTYSYLSPWAVSAHQLLTATTF